MHPIAKSYGYTPTWFDWLTGYDYGVDKCLRSGADAYLCYVQYFRQVRDNIGWTPQLINTLIVSAEPYSKGSAIQFWKSVESNFLKWIKSSGYHPDDLPKFNKVIKIMDSFSDSAFSYDEIEKSKKTFFQDVGAQTSEDIWNRIAIGWNNLPQEARIAIIAIGGLYTVAQLAQLATLFAVVAKSDD
jgi:hypothetical protein